MSDAPLTVGEGLKIWNRHGLYGPDPDSDWFLEVAGKLLELEALRSSEAVTSRDARIRELEIESARKQAAIVAIAPFCKVKYGMATEAVEAIEDEAHNRRTQGYGLLRAVAMRLWFDEHGRGCISDSRVQGRPCSCGRARALEAFGIGEEPPVRGTAEYERIFGTAARGDR